MLSQLKPSTGQWPLATNWICGLGDLAVIDLRALAKCSIAFFFSSSHAKRAHRGSVSGLYLLDLGHSWWERVLFTSVLLSTTRGSHRPCKQGQGDFWECLEALGEGFFWERFACGSLREKPAGCKIRPSEIEATEKFFFSECSAFCFVLLKRQRERLHS